MRELHKPGLENYIRWGKNYRILLRQSGMLNFLAQTYTYIYIDIHISISINI